MGAYFKVWPCPQRMTQKGLNFSINYIQKVTKRLLQKRNLLVNNDFFITRLFHKKKIYKKMRLKWSKS